MGELGVLLDVVGDEAAGGLDPAAASLDVEQDPAHQLAREPVALHPLVDLGVDQGADVGPSSQYTTSPRTSPSRRSS